jgi:indole-3-glycerol phosphate synthase
MSHPTRAVGADATRDASEAGGSGAQVDARPTVLDRILRETRGELEERKRDVPLEALEARVSERESRSDNVGSGYARSDDVRSGQTLGRSQEAPSGQTLGRFGTALARPGIGVIAEFKRRSPSAGRLREDADVGAIAAAYERGGASALSILTETPNFEGSLDDLRAARAACGLPILRKDFIVDPYQLHEARVAGADAVLLIVAALHRDELATLHDTAIELGLDVLVEVHDSDELACAASIGARLIGVNNRDLRDFTVDLDRTLRLLGEMPAAAIVVSESGIATPEQLCELEREGVAAVLVGETLMRAADPQRALASLLQNSQAHSDRGNKQGSKSFIKRDGSL